MHFSARTNWETTETDLARALRERKESGLPIYDLTASNPTQCGFTYDEAAILSPLAAKEALIYDPNPQGMLRAREAVSAYYSRPQRHRRSRTHLPHHQHQRSLQLPLPPALRSGRRNPDSTAQLPALRFPRSIRRRKTHALRALLRSRLAPRHRSRASAHHATHPRHRTGAPQQPNGPLHQTARTQPNSKLSASNTTSPSSSTKSSSTTR